MQIIHERLKKSFSWYDQWHKHSRYQHAHWFELFAFLLVVTSLVSVQAVLYSVEKPSAQAADLPAPNHSIMFGYYKADANYGNFSSEVSSFTNTRIIAYNDFLGNNDTQGFINALTRAVASSDSLWAEVATVRTGANLAAIGINWDSALNILKNYWNSIDYIYLADEPDWNKALTESVITSWENKVTALGLSPKPIAINFLPSQILTNTGYQATNLDVVGTEAYVNPCNLNDCPRQNEANLSANLNNEINQLKSAIGNRQMFLVIQGYNRNGAWTNLNSLQSIQTTPYLNILNNANVIGLFVFSYGRESSSALDSRSLTCLKTEHQRIWGAISGTAQPASVSCGVTPPPGGTINWAPILSRWTPTNTDPKGVYNGWYSKLSPDARYVSYGNEYSFVTDLQQSPNQMTRLNDPATDYCTAGFWIENNKLSVLCDTSNTTRDTANRYEVNTSDWIMNKTSDDPRLVAGNMTDAADGHWASGLAVGGRIAFDNKVVATGQAWGVSVGLGGYLAFVGASDNTIQIYQNGNPKRSVAAQFLLGPYDVSNDYLVYSGYDNGQIRGVYPNGNTYDMSILPSGVLNGQGRIFFVDGVPWIANSAWDRTTDETYVALHRWCDRNGIFVKANTLGGGVDDVIYDSAKNEFVIASVFGGDASKGIRGGHLEVARVSRNAPVSDVSGAIADPACLASLPGISSPTPTPSPIIGPKACAEGIVRDEVPIICDFYPTIARPGDSVDITGAHLSNTVQLFSSGGARYTTVGTVTVNASGSNVTFNIPVDAPEDDYNVSVIGSNNTTSATNNQILRVTLVIPSSTGGVGPFGQPIDGVIPQSTTNLGQLISGSLSYAVYGVGVAIFVMILYAGFLWMTSAANPGNIAVAKRYMTNAIIGAVLLLSSYIILYTINPDLVGGTVTLPGIVKTAGNQGIISQPICTNGVCDNNNGISCTQNTDCHVVCVNNICNNGTIGACTLDTDCQVVPRFLAGTEAQSAEAFSAGCSKTVSGYQDFSVIECPDSASLSLSRDIIIELQDTPSNQQVGATVIQNNGNNGAGRKVVILDTGYNRNHPELSSSYRGGWDFVNNDTDPTDDHSSSAGSPGHGSHVAGIITADGVNGQAKGIAPQTEIIAGKILDSKGQGNFSTIITAIYWAINGPDNIYGTADDFRPDAINLSVGAGTYTNLCDNNDATSREMAKAIQYARSHGVVVVIAAGNLSGGVSMPGCINGSFTVGAVDSFDRLAGFSGKGAGVDIVAPGVNLFSSLLSTNYGNKSGTSMATPMVSGLIALIKKAFPNYTPDEVERAIISTATDLGTPGKDTAYGWGRISATAAGTGSTACSGICGTLVASPASCTKGSITSNPNCNITLSYTSSGTSPSALVIKKDNANLQTLTSANGNVIDNNPTAGTYIYSLQNNATGAIISSTTVYVYYTGTFTSPWLSCTKNVSPSNLECNVTLNYNLAGNISGNGVIYKDGTAWRTINLPSGSVSDINPTTGTHTYTIRDSRGQVQVGRVVINIGGAVKTRVINPLSSSTVHVGSQITITGTNLAREDEWKRSVFTVQIHDKNRVRHTTLGTLPSATANNTSGTWTVNLGNGMQPGNYTLRVGPTLNPNDISNEINLTILP